MRRALALLLIGAALLAGIPAEAFWNSRGSGYNVAVGPTYTGPGDVVASATAWYGLRGYSAAYAAPGTGKSLNVRRASDNATQDIVILSSGAFDLASYNTFVGTDATCTGSMVGTTTLTISACASGTLHVNDPISGAGITQPAYITVIGTCAAPPGTCTVNVAQTFASETVTAQVAGFVTKAYDQTANGNDISQATAGSQPPIGPTCESALPCITGNSGLSLADAAYATALAQPYTIAGVQRPTGTFQSLLIQSSVFLQARNNVNQIIAAAGTNLIATTVSNTLPHWMSGVLNGASSTTNTDNSVITTGNAGANTITAAAITVSAGNWEEVGLWGVGFTPTQQTNSCHNAFAYWGTQISC